ncbi:Hypothetical protein PBC10988_26250 [Planctomycetales bacterium 10988]|nr:Hypothetical protein PBC10988_26250 [Planctomycetales bacterium 10988]
MSDFKSNARPSPDPLILPIPDSLKAIFAPFRDPLATEEQLPEILSAIQARYGYLPERHLRYLTREFPITLSRVYKVAFAEEGKYTFDPPGKHRLGICLGPYCSQRNSEAIVHAVSKSLDLEPEDTTPDGQLSLQIMYCAGHCRQGPILMADDEAHFESNPERACRIAGKLRGTEGE